MSKFLVTAAEVVGAVALVATGIGAAASVGAFGTIAAGSATANTLATIATVAKVAGVAAAALGVAAQLTAKKPSQAGSPEEWKANPDQGIDLVFGDAYNAGGIVYRQTYGDQNKYETIVTTWSLGPVGGIDQLYVDGVAKAVAGGVVDIDDRGKMYEARQRGLCPEPATLTVAPVQPHGWTAQHKLSGKAATITTFVFDQKGGHTFTSIPNCGWRGRGLLGYDARKDDTYPGGAGPQRAGDRSTWAVTRNGAVLAASFALGWLQNGHLAGGAGLPVSGLLMEQFVEAANVADANGWTCGGVKSTTDNPWDVFTDLLQSAGAEPLDLGARVGCLVKVPRVRLATIDRNALAKGKISVPAMRSRRDRINAVTPTFLQEQQVTTADSDGNLITTTSWASAPGAPIVVDDYVTADGKQRRKPISYPLVQCYAGGDAKQVAQLARYDIEDSREIDGISLPLKLEWYGYKPGDCLGLKLPEAGIEDQDIVIRNRGLEPSSATVTITARSETSAKHAFALGQTTTPPASPSIAVYSPAVAAPAAGSWTVVGETLTSSQGSVPALLVTGASDNDQADAVIIEQRLHADGLGVDDGWYNGMLLQPSITRLDITAVAPGSSYEVSVRYRVRGVLGKRLILAPSAAGQLATARGAYSIRAFTDADNEIAGADQVSISVNAVSATLDDGRTVALPAGTVAGLTAGTFYGVFWSLSGQAYAASPSPAAALFADSNQVFLGWQSTQAADGGYATTPAPAAGSGGGGSRPIRTVQQ